MLNTLPLTYSQEFAPLHRLDSQKFGTFLFFPETPDTASVNIQFYAFDRSPHDVVVQFPPTALCAGRVFTFTRSYGDRKRVPLHTGTFEIQTAREIWEFLVANGWIVNMSPTA